MDKLDKIKASLLYIDSISKAYIESCKNQVVVEQNYKGEEYLRRMAELENSFKNTIKLYCYDIIENIKLFQEVDSKATPIDVNDTALFNVGNVLATNPQVDLRVVARMVQPFASNKSAIALLKGMAMSTYKDTVAIYETPEEYLNKSASHMNNIINSPFACIGLISDVRRLLNLYAKSNGYEFEDVPSAEFNQLRLNRIASMMDLGKF